MEKLQVLFPEKSMRRLREVAKAEDRPMSEIVRRATEDWLDSQPAAPSMDDIMPVFALGLRVTDDEALRELAYIREDGP
jgi:predicted transcriptional regulator